MTGNQLSSQAGRQLRNSPSLGNLQRLTTEQQQLLTWMAQQEDGVSVAEIAAWSGQSDAEVRMLLAYLSQQNLVLNIGADRYRGYTSPPEERTFSDQLLQTVSPGKPLAVILNSSGKDAVTPGSTFELGVTVTNRGSQSAVVHIFIDDLAPLLRQWCQSSQEYLALAPEQSGEVIFRFEIPVDILPGIFHYLLVVDAPQHYPEYPPARYSQELEVLPPSQDIVKASDPTFVVQPITSSAKPAILQPGTILQLQVLVYNRSERVDRFRLVCTDFPNTWYTITYPQDTQGFGLVMEADSLGLNPGDRGQILLLIAPPPEALAGHYVPTLQLYSENNPDLHLLDVVYLQLLPIYLLQPALRPVVNRIGGRQTGVFEVLLLNEGNAGREVLLRPIDVEGDKCCTYTLNPEELNIRAKETARARLTVKPHKWWRRPWWGAGRVLNFQVEIEDRQYLPLPTNVLPGYVTWTIRPWWQLLLVALAGLGTLAVLVWLIWWLFFRPPVSPKIQDFYVEDSRYSADNGDIAQVGWQIQHPDRIASLKLVGKSPDGQLISGPLVFEFNRSLPPALQPFCTSDRVLLTCKSVRTDARKPGEYVFELTLIPKRGRQQTIESRQTERVAIDPIPLPKVLEFKPTQAAYLEVVDQGVPANPSPKAPATPANASDIRLNWAVTRPQDITALQLVGRTPDGAIARPPQRFDFSQGIPKELQGFCAVGDVLVCRNVATGVRRAGDYIFELTPIGKNESTKPPEPTKRDRIQIVPRPPQILSFRVNNQEARPKYLIPITPGKPPLVLVFSWEVEGGTSTKVELLPSPGSVPLRGAMGLPITQQPDTSTITLQVSNGVGQPVNRSVTIETFNPNPSDPAATAAAVAAAVTEDARQKAEAAAQAQRDAAAAQAAAAAQQAAGGQQVGGAPTSTPSPSTTPAAIPTLESTPPPPGRLSPTELPPQLN